MHNTGPAELAGMLFAFIFILAVLYVPLIFFCLTLQNTLKQTQPQNRTMSPGQVWLLLIPIFSLGWGFYVVIQVRDALRREYQTRDLPVTDDFGFAIGMTMAGLACGVIIPFLGLFMGIGHLVLWIIYWVKITGYKNNLMIQSQTLNVR